MPIRRRSGEKKEEFVSRCIAVEVENGKSQDQAAAICYNIWEDKQLSAIKNMRKSGEDDWLERFLSKNKIGTHISELGLSKEDLRDEFKFEVDDIEKFAIKESDITDDTIDYYSYETSVEGHRAQRKFCKLLMKQSDAGYLFTFEDIVALNNAPGKADRKGGGAYSVFKYRGGVHCKHKWVKYRFSKSEGKLKSKVQPKQDEVGYINK